MKKLTLALTAIFLSTVLASADDAKMTQVKTDMKKAINCATAEADIKKLNTEKERVNKETVSGIFSITPIGLLTNAATDPSDAQKIDIKIYDKMIDAKIVEIKKACHIK